MHFVDIIFHLFWIANKRFRFFWNCQLKSNIIRWSKPVVWITVVIILKLFIPLYYYIGVPRPFCLRGRGVFVYQQFSINLPTSVRHKLCFLPKSLRKVRSCHTLKFQLGTLYDCTVVHLSVEYRACD